MHITWHGQYSLRITTKEATILLDPNGPGSGLTPIKVAANIVALSNPSDPNMSHVSSLSGKPVVINTPGEYAFADISLHAISWHTEDGEERSMQRWVIEGMTLLHLGARTLPLKDEELQDLERTDVDILLISVGGGTGFGTKDALEIISSIEPRVVIPIHYQVKGVKEDLEPVETFAKEMGVSTSKVEKKALIKKNKLPQEDIETIILSI